MSVGERKHADAVRAIKSEIDRLKHRLRASESALAELEGHGREAFIDYHDTIARLTGSPT